MKQLGEIMKWKIQSSKYLFCHKYLTIRKDSIITQSGVRIPDFFVVENPSWVNVIAITEDGQFEWGNNIDMG